MLIRLSLGLLATIAFGFGLPVEASPITYDFTANLTPQLSGARQLSGTFTINGDVVPTGTYPYASVNQGGSDVSISFNVGGQNFHFDNQSGPYTSATFSTGPSASWLIQGETGPPQAETTIEGLMFSVNGSPGATFAMSFYSPAATSLNNLRDLSFPLSTGTVFLAPDPYYSLEKYSGYYVTSIELVPTTTPEPSTLATFAILGAAVLGHRRLASVRKQSTGRSGTVRL